MTSVDEINKIAIRYIVLSASTQKITKELLEWWNWQEGVGND